MWVWVGWDLHVRRNPLPREVTPPSPGEWPGGTKGSRVGQQVTCFSLEILLPCVLPCPAPGDTQLTSQLLEAPCGAGLLPIMDFVSLLSIAGRSSWGGDDAPSPSQHRGLRPACPGPSPTAVTVCSSPVTPELAKRTNNRLFLRLEPKPDFLVNLTQ